jgi:hypothetical protein
MNVKHHKCVISYNVKLFGPHIASVELMYSSPYGNVELTEIKGDIKISGLISVICNCKESHSLL